MYLFIGSTLIKNYCTTSKTHGENISFVGDVIGKFPSLIYNIFSAKFSTVSSPPRRILIFAVRVRF